MCIYTTFIIYKTRKLLILNFSIQLTTILLSLSVYDMAYAFSPQRHFLFRFGMARKTIGANVLGFVPNKATLLALNFITLIVVAIS